MMQFFILTMTSLLGLMAGSFLAAYSFRLPRRISIAKGRSFCPNCRKQIDWFDNIPLLSFLILDGKCRHCRKNISYRYPLIEFFTALGFFYIAFNFYQTPVLAAFYLIIYCLSALIFIIDLEHQIIPDKLIFSGITMGFLYYLFTDAYFYPRFLAGFTAASFLLLIHLLTKGGGMGLGDVKFAVVGGLIVDLKFFLIWLFLSFFTGGMV